MEKAAVKIQAAYRGFQVRQCQPLRKLRQIADVRTKLKKLNMRACDPVYIDKLCSDPMENRKMKEEIMALLLELDAIQGVLPVVRKIRKSVTRDVVQFQEIVDAVKVDPLGRNEAEENPRSTGQVNSRGSEQANLRASVPVNPPLRRVVSLDDNVYPEQSYAYRPTKKKPSDGAVGDSSNRSSDDDTAPRRKPDGWVKNPLLNRSMSGSHRSLATKVPVLARTFSEAQRNAGVRNPLLGRNISEVVRKPANKSPLLGRSISEVQRKKGDVIDSSSPSTDVHKNLHPKTPPISDDKVSVEMDSPPPPPRHRSISFGREEAAIRIQATYRGHLSRRSRPLQHLRTISVVNMRLRELNWQFADPTCAERLRMDEMERLKWSEEITALLLKLDSVQGVVQAIRDIRKSVTREVIKLQEKVDNVVHEADVLSRIAQMESDSSVASTEEFSVGTETSDQESQDHDRGEGVRDSSPKPSAPFEAIVGDGHAQVQHDSRLWDDKYMDLQKPFNFEPGFDGSTVSCPSEKGNDEGEVQSEQARVQRKMKRVLSGSRESSFSESQNAFEIQQSDILSSGRFPTEDGRSLILSSSVSAAGTQTEGKQQPLVLNGGVNSQHPSLARTQKKLKRIEKVQNATVSGAVSWDLDSSAAVLQDQLTSNPNGYGEKPVEAVLDGIPPSEILTAVDNCPHSSVYSAPIPSTRTSDVSSPAQVKLGGDSNDILMLPGEEFHSDREQQGGDNGLSPPRFVPCRHHLPEERACEFLRSRAGHCEEYGSGSGEMSNGETEHEDDLPTSTSEVPAVHRPSEDQWEVDRLAALMDENSRLKILLSQVLEHAEDQAHDLEVTRSRLAKLEKERVQHTKKEDTGVRKKTTFVRRRR